MCVCIVILSKKKINKNYLTLNLFFSMHFIEKEIIERKI